MDENELMARLAEAGIDIKELKHVLCGFLQLPFSGTDLEEWMKREAIEKFVEILK